MLFPDQQIYFVRSVVYYNSILFIQHSTFYTLKTLVNNKIVFLVNMNLYATV